jgi:general secretion pathway protein I
MTNSASLRQSGFTLIEVLAAMLIMAVVLPVALRGVSLALAAASNARHLSEASSLAQSKLNELAVEGATGTTDSGGDFMPDHPGYQWQLQTADRDYGVTELDLTVTWQERGQNKTLTLTTLVLAGTTGTSGGLMAGGAL